MIRRLLVLVALFAVALGVWTLATRFAVWGDELAISVAGFMAEPPPVPAASDGSIHFVECCDSLRGTQGFTFGILALLIAGGPLAFVARVLERRRDAFGVVPVTAASCQAGFIVQGASLCLGVLIVYAFVRLASPVAFVHWTSATALLDIVAGIPALFEWRRLQAAAFAEPRSVLNLRYRFPRAADFAQ